MTEFMTTHLYDWHKEHASAMHEFAGYMMPIRYSGINDEHMAVRHTVGMFDVTHMGRFHFRGEKAVDFANYMTSNDVRRLDENRAQYTLLCNENGGIIDDCIIYYRSEDWVYIVVNAGNKVKDLAWFKKHAPKFEVSVEDVSDQVPNFAIQGPKAEATLQKLTSTDLSTPKFFSATTAKLAGYDVIMGRSGYTGEDGFEISQFSVPLEKPDAAVDLWTKILEAGKEFGILPCGLGARDTLRMEAALPLHGNDITETITPLEARLRTWVKFKSQGDFIGRAALEKQKEEGVPRYRIGLLMPGRRAPRPQSKLIVDDKTVGEVTSGTLSPVCQLGIGLGYVLREFKDAEEIMVDIRGTATKAKVLKPSSSVMLTKIKELEVK